MLAHVLAAAHLPIVKAMMGGNPGDAASTGPGALDVEQKKKLLWGSKRAAAEVHADALAESCGQWSICSMVVYIFGCSPLCMAFHYAWV